LVANGSDKNVRALIDKGCWTPVEHFSSQNDDAGWRVSRGEGNQLQVYLRGELQGEAYWPHPGEHNLENALAALVACHKAGLSLEDCLSGLGTYNGVKRRMELLGDYQGVRIYDDFAHHPTAIKRSLEGAREICSGRLLAVLEPRSNTMKMGVHQQELVNSLSAADEVWALQPEGLDWNLGETLSGDTMHVMEQVTDIVSAVKSAAQPGDVVVIMSNGGFGGIYTLFDEAFS